MRYSSVAPFIPLSSFVWTSKGIWKVFFGGSIYPCPKILVSSHLMWGDSPVRWSPRFPLVLVACVCFPCVSRTLILLPHLSKNSSHTPTSSSYVVFEVWNFSKKESSCTFNMVRLLLFKTPLMVDFSFIRQEASSISFFFARLGVFLEFSGGHRPQVGFFFIYLETVELLDLF